MMPARKSVLVLAAVMMTAHNAGAHHSFSAVYDDKRTVSVTGVVTQFKFVNPHALMSIDVTDERGTTVKWTVEFPGRLNLSEVGWTAESIKNGERLTVTGNPAHIIPARLSFSRIAKSDGTVLLPGGPRRTDAIEAERRERARLRAEQKKEP